MPSLLPGSWQRDHDASPPHGSWPARPASVWMRQGNGKGQDQITCTARQTPVLRHRTAHSGTFLWILPDALTSSKSAKALLEAYRQHYKLMLIKRSPHNDNMQ